MTDLSNAESRLLGIVMSISDVFFTDFTSFEELYDFFRNNDDSTGLYQKLCELYFNEDRYAVKNMVKTCYYYYLINHPRAPKFSEEELVSKFISDKSFGVSIIDAYYELFFDKEQTSELESDLLGTKMYQESIAPYKWEIRGINDYLREHVKSVFNFVFAFEDDKEKTLEVVYNFIKGTSTTENIYIKEKIDIIRSYFPYFVKIMYYDIYKYVSFKEAGTSLSKELYLIINDENINWSDPKLFDYDMFKMFIDFIRFSGKEREEAIKSLTSTQRRLILNNVPLSALDEF